jgi:Protein of unknown function (DUF1203)
MSLSQSAPVQGIGWFMASFELSGIPYEPFAALFSLSDQDLRKINARRVIADSNPGYPCRVSLTDAAIGEELLLLPYEHQPAPSPYRSSGPIFVRKHAVQKIMDPGLVPDYVRLRLMSVRAYDTAHQMTDALVCPGSEAADVIEKMFAGGGVEYIHLHNANRGCFSCSVRRANVGSDRGNE